MASYGYGIDWTFIADVDFENRQYELVAAASTQNYVKVPTGTSGSVGAPIGIIQDNPSAGMSAQVRLFGMSKAIVDASNSSASYGQYLSPVAASPRKLERHAPTKTGSPFALCMEIVNSGSVYSEVWILGAVGLQAPA